MNIQNVFSFNNTAPTEIYTLSLHDALPIWSRMTMLTSTPSDVSSGLRLISAGNCLPSLRCPDDSKVMAATLLDRKSTRLNSSHVRISYAVFCLKKKKKYGNK